MSDAIARDRSVRDIPTHIADTAPATVEQDLHSLIENAVVIVTRWIETDATLGKLWDRRNGEKRFDAWRRLNVALKTAAVA